MAQSPKNQLCHMLQWLRIDKNLRLLHCCDGCGGSHNTYGFCSEHTNGCWQQASKRMFVFANKQRNGQIIPLQLYQSFVVCSASMQRLYSVSSQTQRDNIW
jgi:hypothetical protein